MMAISCSLLTFAQDPSLLELCLSHIRLNLRWCGIRMTPFCAILLTSMLSMAH
jgi:hypothetical protein